MTRNQKNLLKFALATLATFGALYCVSVDHFTKYHAIGLIVCVAVFLGYCYHVFNDNGDQIV